MSYSGKEYRSQWWTQGDRPDQGGVWVEVRDCSGTTPDPGACPAAWASAKVYLADSTVTYAGKTWKAKWWTQGNVPGAETWGPWTQTGACTG